MSDQRAFRGLNNKIATYNKGSQWVNEPHETTIAFTQEKSS